MANVAATATVFASPAKSFTLASETQTSLAPISDAERTATLEAMKPPKRKRSVIAVLGSGPSAETTDYVVPYAVLAQSGIADVFAVSTDPGPLRLHPAFTIEPNATTRQFDVRYPDGGDYVIVPALSKPDAPAAIAWIKSQAAKGATIMSICGGALTLSAAGLLAGHKATGLWEDMSDLKAANPSMIWVPNRRYVADRGIITTTGVRASLPASLALVEAISDTATAGALAAALGVSSWDALHDSSAFKESERLKRVIATAEAARPSRKHVATQIADGVDELALAFAVDAWARTRWERACSFASSNKIVTSQRGLKLIADQIGEPARDVHIVAAPNGPAGRALDVTLTKISAVYGADEAWLIAGMLEYPFGERQLAKY